ncbi:cullin 5 [Angomonas deanei]|nr:cullin 5 [Angomonas deanei]|eukprot:EPY33445.1 cullin 5 [Angomonas deanei]
MSSNFTSNKLIDAGYIMFNFDELWQVIEKNCYDILTWSNERSNIAQVVVESYSLVYQLLSHPCTLPETTNDEFKQISRDMIQIYIINERRQALFESFLKSQASELLEQTEIGENSHINSYIALWRSFIVATVHLKTIFSRLIPSWYSIGLDACPFEKTEDVSLKAWIDVVLTESVRGRISHELGQLIKYDRESKGDGGCLGTELKDEFAMLPDRTVYKKVIEDCYVSQMNEYYRSKTENLMKKGIFAYCECCVRDLEGELVLAEKYLADTDLVVNLLIGEMVDRQIKIFEQADLSSWILSDDTEMVNQYGNVFSLLSNSMEGLKMLESTFKTFFTNKFASLLKADEVSVGKKIVLLFKKCLSNLKSLLLNVNDTEGNFEAVFGSGIKYGFVESTKGVLNYENFANLLAELLSASSQQDMPLPFLTREDTIDTPIDDIISVIYFVPENVKELVLRAHQSYLARHLILGQLNEDYERNLLLVLSSMYQSPIYFKCFTMLKSAVSGAFHVYDAILVHKGTWPISNAYLGLNVPRGLQQKAESIYSRLQDEFPGRVLTVSNWYSFGTVRVKSCQPPVSLLLTLPQIAVAFCFPSLNEEVPFGKLHTSTKMTAAECAAALYPFVKTGVLLCEWPPSETSPVTVNRKFQTNAGTLNLIPFITPQMIEPGYELTLPSGKRDDKVLSDSLIDTQVVQSVKKKGSISFNDILLHFQTNFGEGCVTSQKLKKSIETLIGKGYLSRSESSSMFTYEL